MISPSLHIYTSYIMTTFMAWFASLKSGLSRVPIFWGQKIGILNSPDFKYLQQQTNFTRKFYLENILPQWIGHYARGIDYFCWFENHPSKGWFDPTMI